MFPAGQPVLWILCNLSVLSLHSLAKLGCVLIRTRFVLTLGKFCLNAHVSPSDMLSLGRVCGQALVEDGTGGILPTLSPWRSHSPYQLPALLSTPALGCRQPVFTEPGRNMKGGHVSWGSWPTHRGAWEEILVASSEASFSFSSRTTLLVELSCEGSQVPSYLPGEHLGVFPCNQPALVQGILERVVDGPAPHQPVCLETLCENGEPSAGELG